MTKNGKIALGCGGAGCLGLIVLAVAGGLIYFMWGKSGNTNRVYNFNVSNSNSNRNSNNNSNSDSNANANTTNNNSSSSTSSMTDDEKHKLYQAAAMTGDTELLRRVSVKLGLLNEDFTPGDDYVSFIKDHAIWAYRNADFIASLDSREKAMAYVNEHMP
jgi:hypothetical protein